MKRRGQSLIEFALILPILLIIVVILADMGRAIAAHVALSNAAREGARYAAMHPEDIAGIRNRVILEYNNTSLSVTGMELLAENIVISFPEGAQTPGSLVRVSARCRFPLFFGSFYPAGIVDEAGTMLLQGMAEMVIM